MKIKTSILVISSIFFISLVMFWFSSCRESNVKSKTTDFRVGNYTENIKVLEIDSCEYLFGPWGAGSVLTHKGNCKYCAERSLK